MLGLTWCVGLLDAFLEYNVLTYINTILTSSQGILVVLALVVDWKDFLTKLKCHKNNQINANSTSIVNATSMVNMSSP